MAFIGVYKAIYDYAATSEEELAMKEGDILYVLDKGGEDGWWKAKKKASADDDDEPEGLVPENYVEEAHPTHTARALYDYTRQTDEELSFTENTQLDVFDTSDPDWILVGFNKEYGFVPANYIELAEGTSSKAPEPPQLPPAPATHQAPPEREDSPEPPESPDSPPRNPATALAGIIAQRSAASDAPPPNVRLPPRPEFTPEASDEEEPPPPALPGRPPSQSLPPRTHSMQFHNEEDYPRSPVSPAKIAASPPHNRVTFRGMDEDIVPKNPGGFHLYNISEMVSVQGKRKKMPTTLGINLATGTILIAPEKTRDGRSEEWSADRMTHYSIEGKHIFLELVRPSRSIDFHAGAKDTAEEIVSALGDLAGAMRAEGLSEVLRAASGHEMKKGVILYDFKAQGDDEVTVAVGDEVLITDSSKSDEWWQVRRMKNGKEGVVPSSYIEITGTITPPPSSAGLNAARSTVENNRLEEERLAKEAAKSQRRGETEVGPGMQLPERRSSLMAVDNGNSGGQQRRRESQKTDSKPTKAKPDVTKVRTWNDRSKSFSVEAQFLALKDGKIHLHKMNGVKIAVPVAKMSVEDLEYVEDITGVSLDEDKPLSDIKRRQSRREPSKPTTAAGASIDPTKKEYDWFQFFLSCGVAVGMCERYSQAFNRDSMDETVLPDVDAAVLRNLGIREGDILKIMRYLDSKYVRTGKRGRGDEGDGEGGLFSGPGGALKNNTRKSRPAPAVQTNDVVDPKAFSKKEGNDSPKPTSEAPASSAKKDLLGSGGFDDDAWDVKPAKQPISPPPTQAPVSAPPPAAPAQPTLTGSMADLSLLSKPLEPVKVDISGPSLPASQPPAQQPIQQQPQMAPQPTGASPSFFTGLNQQQTGMQPQNNGQFGAQQTGYGQQSQMPQNIARQRPLAPQYTQNPNSLMPPPPQRPLSAPQTAQPSAFAPPPLQPQMTGITMQSHAPPGQSLAEISQMRMQQQYNQQQQQMQPQMTGFPGQQNNGVMPQPTGFGQFNNGMQQQNGFGQPQQPQQTGFQQQSFMGQQNSSPFADPRPQQFTPMQPQQTGFQSAFPAQQQIPQPTGVNAFLPPPLQPQQTGFMASQPTGMNGFGQSQSFVAPPVPPIPQQPTMAPLQPQKTGPPPPVRFGVSPSANKLTAQPTGRRANLAQATPQNPFGF